MKEYYHLSKNIIKTRLFRRYNYPKTLPWKLLIEVTKRCNCKCLNCGIWKIKNKEELKLNEFDNLFEKNNNLLWISLTGGEPFLRNDLIEIIKKAKENSKNLKFINIPTNGINTNNIIKKVKEIINLNLETHITISLDGFEKMHDKLRGVKGTFKKAVKTFEELKNTNAFVRFQSTIHQENLKDFKIFYEKYKKDIGTLTFTHTSSKYYNNSEKEALGGKEASDLFKIISKDYKLRLKQDLIEKLHLKISASYLKERKMMLPCTVGFNSAFISSNGEVSPCFFLPSWGNIKEKKFKEIWFSKKADEGRTLIKNKKCPSCWVNCFSSTDIVTYPEKAIIRSYENDH